MGKKKRSQQHGPTRDIPPELADQVVLWAAAMADDAGVVSEKTLHQALHELLVGSAAASQSKSGKRRWIVAAPVPAVAETRCSDGTTTRGDGVVAKNDGLFAEAGSAHDRTASRARSAGDVDAELELMHPDAAALVRPCVLRGAVGVVTGYEIDGRPIEAAWPERKIGVIVDGSPSPSGWQTVSRPGGTASELAEILGIDLTADVEVAMVTDGDATLLSPATEARSERRAEPDANFGQEAPSSTSGSDAELADADPGSSRPVTGKAATKRPKRRRSAARAAEPTAAAGGGHRRSAKAAETSLPRERTGSVGAEIDLYQWQSKALRKWRDAEHRGVVEAVTGSGKTRLAVAAIRRALVDGGQVLIVVPTKELLDQWAGSGRNAVGPVGVHDEMLGLRRGHEIGILGDGHTTATFETHEVIVGIVNTVRANTPIPKRRASSLIVVDECHRVGSESNRGALITEFERRLGLSATVERSDGSHEIVLEFFGNNLIQGCDYRRAIADGVVSRYKLALVGADFSVGEMDEYKAFTRDMSLARERLVREHDAPTGDFAAFMVFVSNLQRFGTMRQGMAAGRYLAAMTGRRRLLAESDAKLSCLVGLAPSIETAERAIVFTDTREAARRSQAALARLGIAGEVIDSSVPARDRRRMLQDFRDGTSRIILAPRVLDEGVDVPAADLAVVMAASSSRRQMIQRMGRVLRRGDGRGYARFAIAFIEDTAEDPRHGSHEEFLSLVEEHATHTRRFGSSASGDAITKFVSGSRAQTAQPAPETVVDRVSASAARSVEVRLSEREVSRNRLEAEVQPTARRKSKKRKASDSGQPKKFLPTAGCTVVTPPSLTVVDRAQAKGFRVTRTEVVKSRSGAVLREGPRNGIVVVDLPANDCLDAEKVRRYVQRRFADTQGKPVQAQSEFAGQGFIYTQAVTRIVWYGKSR